MGENAVLKVSHMEEGTDLLGPYNRYVIWVHGCCFDCEGCLAENAKKGAYESVRVDALAQRIANSPCEGLTISGGEPFLQVPALLELLRTVKAIRDLGVIVYSGFTMDEIRRDAERSSLLPFIDILIDGRYVKALDDGRAYVGSSNQTINYLTPRYADVGKAYYASFRRRAEIKFSATQVVLIGVPSKSVLRIWHDLKDKNGGMKNDF